MEPDEEPTLGSDHLFSLGCHSGRAG
jgi:hypothetical protein